MPNIEESLHQLLSQLINSERRFPDLIDILSSGYKVHFLSEILVYQKVVVAMSEKFPTLRVTVQGAQEQNFKLRGSPSPYIQNASYIIFSDEERVIYEVHLGLELMGASNENHELDISILRMIDYHNHSTRNYLEDFDFMYGIEVKTYSKTRLTKNLARAFVGLLYDFVALRVPMSGAFVAFSLESPLNEFISNYLTHYDIDTIIILEQSEILESLELLQRNIINSNDF